MAEGDGIFQKEWKPFSLSTSALLPWVFLLLDIWSPQLYFKCLKSKDAATSLEFHKISTSPGAPQNRCSVGVAGVGRRSAGGRLLYTEQKVLSLCGKLAQLWSCLEMKSEQKINSFLLLVWVWSHPGL